MGVLAVAILIFAFVWFKKRKESQTAVHDDNEEGQSSTRQNNDEGQSTNNAPTYETSLSGMELRPIRRRSSSSGSEIDFDADLGENMLELVVMESAAVVVPTAMDENVCKYQNEANRPC